MKVRLRPSSSRPLCRPQMKMRMQQHRHRQQCRDVLKDHVEGGLTLKPLCETRWESHVEALKPLRYQLGDVHDANNTSLTGTSGVKTRLNANNIAMKIDFKLVCAIVIWYNILFEVNLTSKSLKTFDLLQAVAQLHTTTAFLQDYRSDEGFAAALASAKELAEELQIKPCLKESWLCTRILLTLPVTVASGERSFSKLKLIKNYLRTTMMQERLNGLATISIESELGQEIDLTSSPRGKFAGSTLDKDNILKCSLSSECIYPGL
ncbi:hypothetical protein SKAU_G00235630 [Synaphobranchus kaupii]|uniref:HAT C-terminal dimerisation domain-containing protein n=1 Tax=Synaphobranchus kaupii TaxID=118154 RepID=A0A9Q1F6F7_SYNKA|nr:hypothetical protein SKAU_G00235630 [Synaphobranchus kaupii]